jgi:general secretion pathway protein G
MTEKRNEGGFTLIELLIVIIILAILAAIVVFAVGTTGQNAKNAACSADAKTFESALEAYKAEVGEYPGQAAPTSATGTPNIGTVLTTTTTGSGGGTVGPFMRELPSEAHYTIWTDGIGGVFVFPANTNYPTTAPTPPSAASFLATTNNFDTGTPCASVPT